MELNFSNYNNQNKNDRKKIENFAMFLCSRIGINNNLNTLASPYNNKLKVSNEISTDNKSNINKDTFISKEKDNSNLNDSSLSNKTIINSFYNNINNNNANKNNNIKNTNINILIEKEINKDNYLDINYQKLYKLLTNVYSKLIQSLYSYEEYNNSFEYRILPSFSNFFNINFNLTNVDLLLPEFYKNYNYELVNLILIDLINKIKINEKIGNELIKTILKITTKIYENYLYIIYIDKNTNNNFSKKRCLKLFKSYFTNLNINLNYKCEILNNIYYIKNFLEEEITILLDCFEKNIDNNIIFTNRNNNYSNTPINILSILSDLLKLLSIEFGHENFTLYEQLKEQFKNLIFNDENIPFNARNTYSNCDSLNYIKFSKIFTIIINIDDILYIYDKKEGFLFRPFLFDFFKQIKIDYNIILISSLSQKDIINLINAIKIKSYINSVFLYKNENKENRIIISSLKDILNNENEKISHSKLLIIDNLQLTIFPYYTENILNISFMEKNAYKDDNTMKNLTKILFSFTHNYKYINEEDIRKILILYYENN